jgi:hypothetical protein
MGSLRKIRYLAIGSSIAVLALGALLLHPDARPLLDSLFGQGKLPPVDFESLELSGEQDEYLVCSLELCRMAQPNLVANAYNVPLAELRDMLISSIDKSPTYFRRSLDLAKQQFEFTERVPSSPYPDVVTIRFVNLGDNRSSLAIYSRSVGGRSDPGRNQDRIESLLGIIEPLSER